MKKGRELQRFVRVQRHVHRPGVPSLLVPDRRTAPAVGAVLQPRGIGPDLHRLLIQRQSGGHRDTQRPLLCVYPDARALEGADQGPLGLKPAVQVIQLLAGGIRIGDDGLLNAGEGPLQLRYPPALPQRRRQQCGAQNRRPRLEPISLSVHKSLHTRLSPRTAPAWPLRASAAQPDRF